MLHAEDPPLAVDLTDREVYTEPIGDVRQSFVGGRGVATRLVHERVRPSISPQYVSNHAKQSS